MTTLFTDFILDTVSDHIKAGGETVSKKHAEERAAICNSNVCGKLTKVRPLPLIKCDGCAICTCPIATKTKFYSMQRLPGKEGTPLTPAEVLQIEYRRRNGGKLTTEILKCPDTTDRWQGVDSKYQIL